MDKTSAIYRVSMIDPNEVVEVQNVIGDNQVKVTGTRLNLHPSSVDFSEEESDSGDFFTVELKIKMTNTSVTSQNQYHSFSGRYWVVLLHYSNGVIKMVGTKRMPLNFLYTNSGTPAVVTLSYKGNLPEKSKIVVL